MWGAFFQPFTLSSTKMLVRPMSYTVRTHTNNTTQRIGTVKIAIGTVNTAIDTVQTAYCYCSDCYWYCSSCLVSVPCCCYIVATTASTARTEQYSFSFFSHKYLHTYIHLHTHIHTYIHAYIHTHTHTYIHTHVIYTDVHMYIRTCVNDLFSSKKCVTKEHADDEYG